ncbi:tetratricopeptide repeat protein [Bradymonadaceae bacterium TMQ3]|nr:tetratricopeptide repeat protein [Bradymonadaceae bacterium TMQ3]TXC75683.1 tetratricopeptide repeat protein [Bradymonadales bacterium TMQ1]
MTTLPIDAIAHLIETAQQEHALSDRALVAAIQLFSRTGDLPAAARENDDVARAVLAASWLLFVAAPRRAPRAFVTASMHLELVSADERDFDAIFPELQALIAEDTPQLDEASDAAWLNSFLEAAGTELDLQADLDTLQSRVDAPLAVLREHHEAFTAFVSTQMDAIVAGFDEGVRRGELSALDAIGLPEDFDRNDPAALRALADERMQLGDVQSAEALLARFVELNPDDIDALVERGIARGALEDLRGAQDDFDRALKRDPSSIAARINRALTHHALGQIEAAIADYDAALEQVDEDADLWTNRAVARFASNNFSGAMADLNRALELNDRHLIALFQRGNVRRVLGELGYALQDYEKAIQIKPDFVDVYAARGYLYLQLEEPKKAAADFGLAIGFEPSEPMHYYNRAHARLLDQDFKGAIADYDAALELAPDDVEALANRGGARMIDGDLEGAVEDWERAIEVDPYYPTPYLKRAAMWIAAEENEQAASDLAAALECAPEDWEHRKDVQETLDEILNELGFNAPN